MGSVNVTHISRLQRFYASIARHIKYLKIFLSVQGVSKAPYQASLTISLFHV